MRRPQRGEAAPVTQTRVDRVPALMEKKCTPHSDGRLGIVAPPIARGGTAILDWIEAWTALRP